MRQLVDSWIRAEREHYGNTLAAALRLLNKTCGTSATHGRVGEWRRGKYVPAPAVLSQMLWRALPWLLLRSGMRPAGDQFQALCRLLWLIEDNGDQATRRLL